MSALGRALGDFLDAHDSVNEARREAVKVRASLHASPIEDRGAMLNLRAARQTRAAVLEELANALNEQVTNTVIRAVASMPGHTTEQGVAP